MNHGNYGFPFSCRTVQQLLPTLQFIPICQADGPGIRKTRAYHVEAGGTYPISVWLTAPAESDGSGVAKPPQTLTWIATEGNASVSKTSLSVYLEYNGVPQ